VEVRRQYAATRLPAVRASSAHVSLFDRSGSSRRRAPPAGPPRRLDALDARRLAGRALHPGLRPRTGRSGRWS